MFKSKKGFTLIELLVVIAIIGILSSVVLASLNTARARGSDAAVKADLAGARAAAELYFDTNSGYGTYSFSSTACSTGTPGGVIGDTNVQAQIDDAYTKNGSLEGKCGASASAYVIAMPLKSDSTKGWCIDNTGNSRQITMSNLSALGACPAN